MICAALGSFVTIVFWLFILGIIVFGIVKALNASSGQVLEENIVERWGTLLPGQAKKRDQFFKHVEKELEKRKVAYTVNNQDLGSTFVADDYLVVRKDSEYRCFIGAVAEGTDLHVNWALEEKGLYGCLLRIPIIGHILASILKGRAFTAINKARAFASLVLDCVREATDKIAEESKIDKTKIKRESSGRLGPI